MAKEPKKSDRDQGSTVPLEVTFLMAQTPPAGSSATPPPPPFIYHAWGGTQGLPCLTSTVTELFPQPRPHLKVSVASQQCHENIFQTHGPLEDTQDPNNIADTKESDTKDS